MSYNVQHIVNTTYQNNQTITSVDLDYIPWKDNSAYNAFRKCENLQSVTNLNQNITDVRFLCQDCPNLVNAPIIPNTITNMWSVFSGCSSLVTPPVIPDSVDNMSQAFAYCSSLETTPIIPNSVTVMGSSFRNCTSLTQIQTIPNSVTGLYWTFAFCTSLTNAPVIPSSVTNMYRTFYNCSNLVGNIYVHSNQISTVASCFFNSPLDKNVYIPFTYENGVNTATYNSFTAVGYSTTERKDGVLLFDIDSPQPLDLYKWRRINQIGTYILANIPLSRAEQEDKIINGEKYYGWMVGEASFYNLTKNALPKVNDILYSIDGEKYNFKVTGISSITDLYTNGSNPQAGDNVYTEDGQITGTITSVEDGYIVVDGKYYYDTRVTIFESDVAGNYNVTLEPNTYILSLIGGGSGGLGIDAHAGMDYTAGASGGSGAYGKYKLIVHNPVEFNLTVGEKSLKFITRTSGDWYVSNAGSTIFYSPNKKGNVTAGGATGSYENGQRGSSFKIIPAVGGNCSSSSLSEFNIDNCEIEILEEISGTSGQSEAYNSKQTTEFFPEVPSPYGNNIGYGGSGQGMWTELSTATDGTDGYIKIEKVN